MKMRLYLLAVLASMALTSCQITENIYLEEDGSGKIAFDVDASELMGIAGDKVAETGQMQDIDSTFTFKQIFEQKKDSIAKLPAAEQARLKKLEDLSVNMKMNAASKEFRMSVFRDFKKATDLQDMMEAMKSIKDLEKAPSTPENPFGNMMNGSSNTDLKYSFDGKTFKRTAKIIDPKLQEQLKDSTGMMKMMFAGSNYTMKYHFPRKVKSVSNPNALFSADRKTVTIPYSLSEYIEQPDKMSVEVILEK
ncbi:MAG TPA: hypothetical protein VK528_12020 [Flavobacterium sp.]|nr:hypothetical protein [Flavobacterium sp.]